MPILMMNNWVGQTNTSITTSLSFGAPGQPSLGIPDVGTLDPNAYIEPMELYDSIFWGEYPLLCGPLQLFNSLTAPLYFSQNHRILGTREWIQ